METTALREQGWSNSAIARHLGHNRETIRNHLNGTRVAGEAGELDPTSSCRMCASACARTPTCGLPPCSTR
jgi:IS30 family transposase